MRPHRYTNVAVLGVPFPGATFGSNFTTNQYQLSGAVYGVPSSIPGWTFTRASTGYAETVAGALVAFASGAPRITDKGLLVEEARTNLLLQSQNFATTWATTGFTISTDDTVAPDGTMTADTATAGGSNVLNQTAALAATSCTYSIYAKQGSSPTRANYFLVRNGTTATNLVGGTVDYGTGLFTYTYGSTGVVIQTLANGWYRICITVTSGITSGDLISVYAGFVGFPEAGQYCRLWGAQLEAGAFATSYIPTTTASATRAADVAKITGYANTLATTLAAKETRLPNATGTGYLIALDDGTTNEIAALTMANTSGGGLVIDGGVTQANLAPSPSVTSGTPFRLAMRYALNDCAACIDGGTVVTDTSATMPTTTQIVIGDRGAGARSANAYIEKLVIYPVAYADAALQALFA